MKVKQLQPQDVHLSEIIMKCKYKKCDKTLCHLDEHGIACRKIKDGPNIFHAVMLSQTLQPYIPYESHNALGHNGLTRLYNFIKKHYYWGKLCQHYN